MFEHLTTKRKFVAGFLSASAALSVCFAGSQKLELYQEYPKPGEAEEFARYAQEIRQIQASLAVGQPISRSFHSKAHGCLRGTFKVNSSIAPDYQYGVFKPNAEYPVWARFSNASGTPKVDTEKDMRGLALKLMKVDGIKIQDFLMTNGPVHFAPDAKGMMEFGEAGAKGALGMTEYFLTHWNAAIVLARDTSRKVGSMVTESYWSRTPYRLGPKAMKFNVVPCDGLTSKQPDHPSPTYLTDDLRERASKGPICFDFRMQLQLDPEKQPIEDASVEWTEQDTPSVTVARVTFPKQEFDSTDQMEFCNDLDYNPWHASEDLRPLGNMNRARKVVYPSSQEFRGASWHEPTGDETFNGDK
jgi:hypothetical protein